MMSELDLMLIAAALFNICTMVVSAVTWRSANAQMSKIHENQRLIDELCQEIVKLRANSGH